MTAKYEVRGNISVIKLINPPVNAWSHPLREDFYKCFDVAQTDSAIDAIVITGSGDAFCGGADITEFERGTHTEFPNLIDIVSAFHTSPKLLVAALNGFALGGGLETALACHYRIATPNVKVGVPEVHLGLLPGAGGTQSLPRLAGVQRALDMIVSGKPISAAEALSAGVIDRVWPIPAERIHEDHSSGLVSAAVDYAREILDHPLPMRTLDWMIVETAELPQNFFSTYRQRIARRTAGFAAPEKCIQAVEAACNMPFRRGLKKEQELFYECLETPQARAQQHLFFAERQSQHIAGVETNTPVRNISNVAIIGAGTMGGGIAMNFINAGIKTTILDVDTGALDRGVAVIRGNYEHSVQKAKLSNEQVAERLALLEVTTNYDHLSDADLVIEAVFEDIALKKKILTTLDKTCKPGAILATNTSTLDVDELAATTDRPQDVIGLHFFSPANVMRLLEVVRGAETSAEVIASCLKIAKAIRKIPIVVGVCYGFVGNRMLEPYYRESHRLLLEGATPHQIDRVLTEFGMAMGIISIADLAGNDVGYHVRQTRRHELEKDASYAILGDKLYELGRYGQKTQHGFYIYDGREKTVDPSFVALAEQTARELGIERRDISDSEVFSRCIYPLINEGAKILDEGIASRSGDIDLIWTNGYGFPIWRGGPMHYANEIGLSKVLDGMNYYRERLGDYGEMWFKPSLLLERLATDNARFSKHDNQFGRNVQRNPGEHSECYPMPYA